jgi:tetratricopeptide (TPR) repeat protein
MLICADWRMLFGPAIYEHNALAAVEHFSKAVDLDPKFAVAWAWLARVSAGGYFNSAGNDVAALRETAKDAVAKVTQLQPNLGEAFLAHGYFHYYCEQNYDAAMASFEKARQLAPKTSDALEALALVSRRRGEWQQSLEYFRQATEIDPAKYFATRLVWGNIWLPAQILIRLESL